MSFVDDVVGPRTPSLLDPGDKIAIELYSKEELPVVIKSETISDSHRELRDGGRRAWLVLAGAFMVIFMTYGYVNSWGIFQAYYAKNLLRASSSSSIAWIGSLQCSLALFIIAAIGRPYDLGYFRSLLYPGSALFVLATFLVAECRVYWHFLLCQGILTGIAVGIGSGIGVLIIPEWFVKYRGFAYGVAFAGCSLGGILLPLAARYLLPRIGFQWTIRLLAIFFAVGSLFVAIALRRPSSAFTNTSKPRVSWIVFKSPAYTIYCAAIFFVYLGYMTLPWYISTTAQALSFSETLTFSIVSVNNASSFVGRIVGGLAADRFGSMNIQIPTMVAAAVVVFIWPLAKTPGALIAVSVLYGLFSGAYVALEAYPVINMSNNLGDAGLLVALTYVFAGMGALLSLPIPAALDASVGIVATGAFSGGAILVGVCLVCATRYILLKKIWGTL